jgi:hypothetical protein
MESEANKNLENPGAVDFMKMLKLDPSSLPFFVLLNKNGTVLADSFVNGQNIGCPASQSEVENFIALLKKTSNINKYGLDIIAARFKQNKPQQ